LYTHVIAMKATRLLLNACCAFTFLVAPPATLAQDHSSFTFAVLGDLPYFAWELLRVEQMIETWNLADLAFVMHVGDIKSGKDLCANQVYVQRKALFERSAHPFVLLPGDNDWTDCHRQSNGGFDPLERLAYFRSMFYVDEQSLGQRKLALARQSPKLPENMRWDINGVPFVTIHVTGSHNGYGIAPAMDAEYAARNRDNLSWLEAAFEAARDTRAPGLVVAIHGNPRFEAARGSRAREGYDDFVHALVKQARAFAKPVLFIHGDTHRYRVDRPLADVPNLVRLETFGSPHVGWVRVTVDPGLAEVFAITPQRN